MEQFHSQALGGSPRPLCRLRQLRKFLDSRYENGTAVPDHRLHGASVYQDTFGETCERFRPAPGWRGVASEFRNFLTATWKLSNYASNSLALLLDEPRQTVQR